MSQTNQRFSVSVHILTLLAANADNILTSDAIATSVDTNPVVIRRTMSHLRQHGLVDSRPGTSGGWRLLRPPAQISLGEVYRLVSHEDVLSLHNHPNPECLVGGNIQESLAQVIGRAQTVMEAELDKFTIADILQDIVSHSG
jgi:Rrf2 family protein